jgi:hypothetical protein
MAVIDSGNNNTGKANVDAAYNLNVTLPQVTTPAGLEAPQYVGASRFFSENDPGTVTGTAHLTSPETSEDYRLRVGVDTVLFTDTFNANIQNTSLWAYTFATMTAIQSTNAGFVTFGAVQGTTSAHGAFMRTFQHFPLIGTAPLSVEFTLGQFGAALVTNEEFVCGVGVPVSAVAVPLDGVWFRISSTGVTGVIRYNGGAVSEKTFGAGYDLNNLTVGELNKFTIVIGERIVEYWIDDVLLGLQDIPVSNGQPFIAASQPAFMMKYNTGNVSNTNTIRVSDVTVSLMDLATNKPWAHQLAAMNQNGLYLQNGHIPASTALLSTQAIGTITTGSSPQTPNTAAAGSNTAAPVTGLGGWGSTNMVAAAATDFLMMSYQNPVPSNIVSGKNLYICGVYIDCINTGAAVATTPTTNLITLGVGGTAASLQTVETASFATGTTHAPRRMQLGIVSAAVGTAIGAPYSPAINRTFTVPLVVRPGEFVVLFFKTLVGTATASQTWTYNVVFDSYWE